VRDTIADRELETWALVDLGPSMDFGTAFCEKRDLAVSAAAAVGFLTARTGNRFGLITVQASCRLDGPAVVTAKRGGRNHLMASLHRLTSTAHGRYDSGRGRPRARGSTAPGRHRPPPRPGGRSCRTSSPNPSSGARPLRRVA
jgi:hypothetical protein